MTKKITTVGSVGAAGGLAVVVIWVFSLAGVVVPADVAVSISSGLMWAVGLAVSRLGVKPPVADSEGGEGG